MYSRAVPGRPRVLIVGAGLGGITAEVALLGRGVDVAIFEQAAELINQSVGEFGGSTMGAKAA
jgi:salicylate hydroxylase